MVSDVQKIIFSGFCLLSAFSLWANDPLLDNSVLSVEIPRFDEEGRLSWRLQAKEVLPAGQNQYQAKDPVLRTIAGFGRITDARTSEGVFDVKEGKASGKDTLRVRGEGFLAQGEDWFWQEKAEEGFHKMAFRKEGSVSFSEVESPLFASLAEPPAISVPQSEPFTKKTSSGEFQSTVADADYMEMVALEDGGYRFLLQGGVRISGNEVEITCSRMEVFLLSEDNSTTSVKFGKIKQINAVDSVTLKQPGRVCHADRLNLDGISGVALLEGSAKVIDEEWGMATGEKIFLESGTRKARIEKTDQVRPRLTLPEIQNFNLPFGKEASGDNQ